MKLKIIIFALLLVNTAGLSLRYFNYDTYFIFLGFRFHISCIIPFAFLIRKGFLDKVKNLFGAQSYNKYFTAILKIILPVIILSTLLYLLGIIRFSDPEYFYEFGLSSVVDYPLYLIWNFPQFIMLFLFLVFSVHKSGKKLLLNLTLLILLFAFELIPFGKQNINYLNYLSFVLIVFISAFFLEYYRNIYLFPVLIFTVLWSVLLLFGSSSHELINILFAARYSEWEGFFEAGKNIMPFIIPGYFVIILISLIVRRNSKEIITQV